MSREFTCEGCGQHIIAVIDHPAPAGRPDLCGGCAIMGPAVYVQAMSTTGWLDAGEAETAREALRALRRRWGDHAAEKPDCGLSKADVLLLEWLSRDRGQVGECKGHSLATLIAFGLARYVDPDQTNDQAWVEISRAGTAYLEPARGE